MDSVYTLGTRRDLAAARAAFGDEHDVHAHLRESRFVSLYETRISIVGLRVGKRSIERASEEFTTSLSKCHE